VSGGAEEGSGMETHLEDEVEEDEDASEEGRRVREEPAARGKIEGKAVSGQRFLGKRRGVRT
jgi:hypothetical protein